MATVLARAVKTICDC